MLLVFSCSKKEDAIVSTVPLTTNLSKEEIKVISQSAMEIQGIVSEIANTTNDLSKISGVLEKKLPDIKKLKMVETVSLSNTSCFVKFLNGGYIVFNFDAIYSTGQKGQRKSYDTDALAMQLKKLKAKILEPNNRLAGKKSVCIIQSHSDESSQIDNEIKELLIDFNNVD